MAFTDNCDLFVAVHEDGINRVIRHIMRQRPSLFNYASADVAGSRNRELWCNPKVEFTSDVTKYGNPIFKIEPPFPVFGSESPAVFIGFCAQVVSAGIDFHPGNKITLPPELGPPLKPQRFSLTFRVCGGLVCPSDQEIEQIPIGPPKQGSSTFTPGQVPPVTLRGRPLCFCVDVFVVGHFEHTPDDFLLGKVDGVEIVDIKPDSLESNLECYLKTALAVVLRERLAISYKALGLSFPLFDLATINLFSTPNPPVPNNPAVEEDQVKLFITMTV